MSKTSDIIHFFLLYRSRDKPPKLPPRDNAIYGPSLWAKPADGGRAEKGSKMQLYNDKRGGEGLT